MVTIAGSVGIEQEAALAFGLLVHVATLLVTSAGGGSSSCSVAVA